MLEFFDYLPSQNCWKVRQILHHLSIPHEVKLVSIFEGEGQRPEHRAVNPTGAVPAIRLEDGRTLAESNAILFYLARGSRYLSDDPFSQAKTLQWLSFEADYVQNTLGAARHWIMTGKARPTEIVAARQSAGRKALTQLENKLDHDAFLVGSEYSVADISMYAYAHLADEAGVPLAQFPSVLAWVDRIRSQKLHLADRYAYSIDPHSARELP